MPYRNSVFLTILLAPVSTESLCEVVCNLPCRLAPRTPVEERSSVISSFVFLPAREPVKPQQVRNRTTPHEMSAFRGPSFTGANRGFFSADRRLAHGFRRPAETGFYLRRRPLFRVQDFQDLARRQNTDFAKGFEHEQIIITSDDKISPASHCSGENHIVVRIAANALWQRRGFNHFAEIGKRGDGFGYSRTQQPFSPQGPNELIMQRL